MGAYTKIEKKKNKHTLSLSPFQWPFSRWTWVQRRCRFWHATLDYIDTSTTSILHREPGLAGSYCSEGWWRWWWQMELWEMQSCSQIVTTSKPTPNFLQVGHPSCRPTNSVTALKGKYHIPWTCLPHAHLFQISGQLYPVQSGKTGQKVKLTLQLLLCIYLWLWMIWPMGIRREKKFVRSLKFLLSLSVLMAIFQVNLG